MRARIHIIGTERVVWKDAEEAARLVADGLAEYAGEEHAPESGAKMQHPPAENKALRPAAEDKRRRR